MSKIYIVDYGLSGCQVTTNDKINKLLETNGWKCTGFNTTYWKDIEDKCDVKKTEHDLRTLIQKQDSKCTVTLLILCVEKSDVIGTKSDEIIFGCDFKFPRTNNSA